jgi:uncharacterized membrane protein (DUF485 family)
MRFRKRDLDFLEMLEDPAKIESRLAELASQRLLFGISAAMAALVFFFVLFVLLSANIRLVGQSSIAAPVSGCLTMVALLSVMLARAIGAHSEIRTLFTFKNLRDMRSID